MNTDSICREENFNEAKSQSGLMVIDAYATWCGPCKAIAPKVVEFSKKYPDARFYKIDVDELSELAQSLEVRAMPTFLLFKDGKKVETVVGANPKALESAIQKHLGVSDQEA